MDKIGQSTGVTGRNNNSHRSGVYGFEGPHAGTYDDIGRETFVGAPRDDSTFQTVDDYSTIRTRKHHGLKPSNVLSEQNVHKYSSNQLAMTSLPPLEISTNDMKSESRSEGTKGSLTGGQSANQREPVPSISAPLPNETNRTDYSNDRLVKALTPTTANTATTPRSQALDLRHNDNAFQVIASLIVDKFDVHLRQQAVSITITLDDRQHLDRVVPDKKRFVDALSYRLQSCPERSMKPIHVVTRKCRSLGLDREGSQNILNAAVGSTVRLSVSFDEQSIRTGMTSKQNGTDDLVRQQLTAELREASNLMAESVTPEASQFWRKHVIELQAKLRALYDKGIESRSTDHPGIQGNAAEIMKNNERLLASLWENTGYVPPNQDELLSTSSVYNNSIVESKAPSLQHSVNDTDPSDMESPMVDVVAPADLPEGFQFEAELDKKRFIATVPAGGVRKGETFSCYMKEMKEGDIPMGRWRDGLFDCLKHGPFHPMLLNSFLCPLLALSQVMSRLGLDFMGKKTVNGTPRQDDWKGHGIMVSIIIFWIVMNCAIISGFEVKLHNYVHLSTADIASLVLVNGSMIVFVVYAAMNTRHQLREDYNIGSESPRDRAVDFASTVFCLPLSIAQMGRHTAKYDEHSGVCCNETGIPALE